MHDSDTQPVTQTQAQTRTTSITTTSSSTETDNKENNPQRNIAHCNKNREGDVGDGKIENRKKRVVCELHVACGPVEETSRRHYGLKDYEMGQLLGSGKYGRVYRATDLERNRSVALKVMDIDSDRWPSVHRQFRREVEIQGNIKHPNIVRLYGFFIEQEKLHLVLEFVERGTLFDHLQTNGVMEERDVANCIQALAKAVQHLHRHGVMHRDIKPENILIGCNGVLKLADFGWSILACEGRQKTLCGTVDYLAPEMIVGKGYDHRVDIWSLGVLCYELLFGLPPFITETFAGTCDRIKKTNFVFPSSSSVSPEAKDLISSILVSNPDSRLGIREILCHPFTNQQTDGGISF